MDKTVRQLSIHISKKVSDSLNTLFRNDRKKYETTWDDLATFVKLGAVQDEKFFERIKDVLIFKTTKNEWFTLPELIERNKDKTKGKLYYTTHEHHHEAVHSVYDDKGIDIVVLRHPVDPYLIGTIEKNFTDTKFQRLDSDVEEHLVDQTRENADATQIADFIRSEMGENNVEVEAKSLKNDNLSAFLVIDENERRFRDYMMQMNPDQSKSALKQFKRKMVVNTNSPLINSIKKLETANPDLAKNLVHEVYELALLTQREMDEADLQSFVKRTQNILEELANIAANK